MSERRNFVVELDELIKTRSIATSMLRRVPPTDRVEDAGYVQGLNAAKLLYEEILSSNLKED